MTSAILVINAGSSSVKFSVFRRGTTGETSLWCKGQLEAIGLAPHFSARDAEDRTLADAGWDKQATTATHLARLLAWIDGHLGGVPLEAAGHRVVHGGRDFAGPVLVTPTVIQQIEALIPLAPLHQPHNLNAIRDLAALHPELPQIACFDTSFHRRNDLLAGLFALPKMLRDEGLQRYGFHGLSYEFIAQRVRELDPELAQKKLVVCHLGNGASMCAIDQGRSVASTMGFTALDGLPMGTRSGQIDPGVLLYLLQQKRLSPAEIESILYKQSGLLGLSGLSSDVRNLAASDSADAALAIDYFIYRIGRELGSLAAAMQGIDGLVFTAGIGEHAVDIRARVVQQAAWLGFILDETANRSARESRISPDTAAKPIWVIPTNEELMIATHVTTLLTEQGQTR